VSIPTNPDVTSAFAPGRVELLGNHTDYNEGLVLGAAIDRGLTISGAARSDDVIRLHSSLMGEVEINLPDLRPQTQSTWANYALGVAQELIDLGIPVGGFAARLEGNLPPRSGLSSSAAFEVATALFLLKLQRRELPPMDVAKLCQRAEHRFVGVQSGLLDQVMSLFGRANHLIFFDTRIEQVRNIPFPDDLALIIAESGKQRELAGGEYNVRREQTHAAAQILGVRALRDITSSELRTRTDLNPILARRARHIVQENERVERAIELLGENDAVGFGRLLNESHESSQLNFENSAPELDLLVELARGFPGVLGARLTGAGFGGAIVALCRRADANSTATRLHEAYQRRTGVASEMFVCEIGDGAA
jgi:galactokinase